MKSFLTEQAKSALVTAPRTTNGGFTSGYVSLKTGHKAFLVVLLTQAVGHATQFSLLKATSVAGAGSVAGPAVPIRVNEDVAASDTLVKQADAASFTVAADVKNKIVIFEVDPAALGEAYDCVAIQAANSGQATNLATILAVVQTRYPQENPPSVIVD